MRLEVEHLDRQGNTHQLAIFMNRLAFAKHFAIAGQHYEPHISKLLRILGVFLMYSNYLDRYSFYKENRFSEPPIEFSDPTSKLQFSNLAGRAIADFLSKRIDECQFTVNYEAVMRIKNIPIKGSRADLIGFTKDQKTISIEAKGFCKSFISKKDMATYKQQSRNGGLKVDYSIACVSYNLYERVRCKYHDPEGEEVKFDSELFRNLTKNYYSGLSSFIHSDAINAITETREFGSEEFIIVNLGRLFYYHQIPFRNNYLWKDRFFYEYLSQYSLILPGNIEELADKGLNEPLPPFPLHASEGDGYSERGWYIDNDRVGIIKEGW